MTEGELAREKDLLFYTVPNLNMVHNFIFFHFSMHLRDTVDLEHRSGITEPGQRTKRRRANQDDFRHGPRASPRAGGRGTEPV